MEYLSADKSKVCNLITWDLTLDTIIVIKIVNSW